MLASLPVDSKFGPSTKPHVHLGTPQGPVLPSTVAVLWQKPLAEMGDAH